MTLLNRNTPRAALAAAALAALIAPGRAAIAGQTPAGSHLPPIVARSRAIAYTAAAEPVRLALALPLRNRAELDLLLHRLYDPNDRLHGQFLTPEAFADRFSPTEADYDAVAAFARAQGLQIVGTHPNRLLLDVAGPAAVVERAFGVRLVQYLSPTGRAFRAPSAEPTLPAALRGRVSAVVGLDTAGQWRTHSVGRPVDSTPFQLLGAGGLNPHAGTGPGGGLSPTDIKTAYNLSNLGVTGVGQTLAVFELDGYTASDITGYCTYFGLPAVPLTNVLVDGFNGSAGAGAGEVTLDIELQIALAPGASRIYVYMGPNSSTGVLDTYNRIATDNIARQISTSWGLDEGSSGTAALTAENTIFTQYAAQGQALYAAAGDSGAKDNGRSLSVDDPASQPYVTGVGGTTLTLGAGSAYGSETTWNNTSGGGGGGISSYWSIPAWQVGAATSAGALASTTKRNVPDVSLDADPYTGYAILFGGKWYVYGGTSCASPLWAAFHALVNERRASLAKAVLGFANPSLYAVGKGARYSADFHDIANGSTNGYYPAVAGYDCATGWGTLNGANLLADLAGVGGAVLPAPTGLTAVGGAGTITLNWSAVAGATSYAVYRGSAAGAEALYRTGLTTASFSDTGLPSGTTYYYQVTASSANGESPRSSEASAATSGTASLQLLLNPGFETGAAAPWVATSGVIDSSATQPAHSGAWKAWIDGYGRTHTDTLYQQVAIPAAAPSASLSFWLHIDTAETAATAKDTLKVQIRSSAGTVLATLATYSNLNSGAGYTQQTFNLSAYKGQTIRVYLVGAENSTLATSFVVDDFALTVP